jgi:hypothetical protein
MPADELLRAMAAAAAEALGHPDWGPVGLVHRTAASLYLRGPAWRVGGAALGCWQGLPPPDICAAMTGTESAVWADNPEACASLIAARFAGHYMLVFLVVAGWLGYRAAAAGLSRLLWPPEPSARQLLRELEPLVLSLRGTPAALRG